MRLFGKSDIRPERQAGGRSVISDPGSLSRTRDGVTVTMTVMGGGVPGIRNHGPGLLGVFLRYRPEDFGLPPETVSYADSRLRRALGEEIAASRDSPYDLTWLHQLQEDDDRGIRKLRAALASETNIIGRHFIYAELEAALYRARNESALALDEYDEACRRHDAEMDRIRQACLAYWGKMPAVDTYRQMAIRQQKARDYAAALWWAERGLALYATEAALPEAVADLRTRSAAYRARLAG